MNPEKVFFIYVAKNDEWQRLKNEDWQYVSSMVRFFKWWMRRYFDVRLPVEADILPVIPGKVFDRMSLAYLIRDHSERGNHILHFYLAYFRPFWTDCNTEGYTAKNLGIVWWQRPADITSDNKRQYIYGEKNCSRVSHILTHELLRISGKTKNIYFGKVHDLWNKHINKNLPFLYFDSEFRRVRKENSFRFSTLDPSQLSA